MQTEKKRKPKNKQTNPFFSPCKLGLFSPGAGSAAAAEQLRGPRDDGFSFHVIQRACSCTAGTLAKPAHILFFRCFWTVGSLSLPSV